MRPRLDSLLGLSILLLLPLFTLRAEAQAFDCAAISGINEPTNSEVTGCLKPIVNYHSLIAVSDAVRKVVAGNLIEETTEEPEPAGLRLSGPQDVAARLAAPGRIKVEPAADVPAAPAEQRLWNVWIDGKYTWIEGGAELEDSEGPLVNAMGGIDYRIATNVVVGLLVTYESSRLETEGILPVEQRTEGYGGGAYLGVTVTPNIVFSALASYAVIDTEVDNIIDGEADSDRVQLSGGLTGYWYAGTTRFSPSVTAAWSKEWQDEYTNGLNPAQDFETAILTGGTVLGHTFAMGGSASIEPFAGAFIDYTLLNEIDTDGLGVESFDEQADLRVQLGLNLNLAANVQMMLMGEASGLIIDESDSYAGEANLAVQF